MKSDRPPACLWTDEMNEQHGAKRSVDDALAATTHGERRRRSSTKGGSGWGSLPPPRPLLLSSSILMITMSTRGLDGLDVCLQSGSSWHIKDVLAGHTCSCV